MDKEKFENFLQRRFCLLSKEKNGLAGVFNCGENSLLKGGGEECRLLHDALLRATFDHSPVDAQRRRASLCLDGTPIVYSLKLRPETDKMCQKADGLPFELPFRMLVEPGGLGITVAEQIDNSLRTVDILLHELGWQSAVDDLNEVIRRVFPRRASELSHWWGGIWLGMDFASDWSELRLYCNLRYGSELARWQRLADVLSWFGDPSLAGPLKSLIERVSPFAVPVGLGLVVSERICGFRLYAGVHEPSFPTIMQAWPNQPEDAYCNFGLFCKAFTNACGPFARQSVTFGFDFLLGHDGLLHPQISRTKVDVSCQVVSGKSVHLLLPLLHDLFDIWHLDYKKLDTFLEDLRICFGGSSLEHVSLGFGEKLDHVTIYAKPQGYDQI
jgi:hypothetical protein